MAKRSIQNATCSANVMDKGATITSWHPVHAHEALFVSSGARESDFEFHGGIPLCAPWFGIGREGFDAPHKHGLVRLVDWRFVGAKQLGDATRVEWELSQEEVEHLPGAERYPSDLRYRFTATFGARLDVALTIESPTQPVVVDSAFHSYFLVNNVQQAEVLGVGDESLRITGAHDMIYPDALAGGNRLEIRLPDRILEIEPSGARDVIVWNPGPDEALPDFSPTDWRRMLCVEIGNVQENAVEIPAGQSHEMGMKLRLRSRTSTLPLAD